MTIRGLLGELALPGYRTKESATVFCSRCLSLYEDQCLLIPHSARSLSMDIITMPIHVFNGTALRDAVT
jgi:hypothetical protein